MALTQAQLALRRQGITGSEIAAVAGLSPYSNATDVWERKLGRRQEHLDDNPHVIRGTLFEKPVLEWFSLLTGRDVHPQGTCVHPSRPLIMATPDGISKAEGTMDRVIEVKCPSIYTARHWGEPGTDAVPIYHLPQLTFEMAVTGLMHADAVLFSGIEPQIYPVAYDADFFEALCEIAERFWRDHVQTQTPPPPDASPHYAEFIARYAPQTHDEPLDLTGNPDATRWLRRLKVAKETQELADSEAELCRNHIKELMGGHATAKLDGGMVTWKNTKPVARVAWKDIAKAAELSDELIGQHTKTSEPSRPFRVKFDT